MSKEFNYKRAWDEYVKPEFEKLSSAIHAALNATRKEVDAIQQVGATMQVTGHSKELMEMFDAIPVEDLAQAHEIVYYYGHLAYGGQCQDGGLYWKFQNLASMSLINRKPYNGELLHQAKAKMEKVLKVFHDHEEGTTYSNEEVPEYLLSISPELEGGLVNILKVDTVNHKPDIFCIGPKHFPKDGGMFIKPEQAPCCNCGQDYSAHTYDTVMFLKPIVKDGEDPDTTLKNKKLPKILEHIVELCKAAKIKLDGFAFVRP
jgi:hypothetical protein